MRFSNIERVMRCFTPGTLITTDEGPVPVESVHVGTRVLTRDNGFQAVRWIGRRDLTAAELVVRPNFQPVRIAAGSLGDGLPERDLLVSPQHRVLVTGPEAELLFGEPEVLVAAVHLVDRQGITRAASPMGISYLHFMCEHHEIIRSEGAWTESYLPGEVSTSAMDAGTRAEILALFPELALGGAGYRAARVTLKRHQAQVLWRMRAA